MPPATGTSMRSGSRLTRAPYRLATRGPVAGRPGQGRAPPGRSSGHEAPPRPRAARRSPLAGCGDEPAAQQAAPRAAAPAPSPPAAAPPTRDGPAGAAAVARDRLPAPRHAAQAGLRALAAAPSWRRPSARAPSPGALRRALLARHIGRAEHDRLRGVYARARADAGRLPGVRGAELRAVVGSVDALAASRRLTAGRFAPVFLTLRRNDEFWRSAPLPAPGHRETLRRATPRSSSTTPAAACSSSSSRAGAA